MTKTTKEILNMKKEKEEGQKEFDEAVAQGEVISKLMSDVTTKPDLLQKVSDVGSLKDKEFGEAVLKIMVKHYPEYKKNLTADLCTSLGRCFEQLMSFNEDEKNQLDPRFEVDYILRIRKAIEDPKETRNIISHLADIFTSMQNDIRFLQTGTHRFTKLLKATTEKVAELKKDELITLSQREAAFIKLYAGIVEWCNARLLSINNLNGPAHRKYEKFPSVDYARRLVAIWEHYLHVREDKYDIAATQEFAGRIADFNQQIGIDDRPADEYFFPVVNAVQGIFGQSLMELLWVLSEKELENKSKAVDTCLKTISEKIDSIKRFTEEPPPEYTGK